LEAVLLDYCCHHRTFIVGSLRCRIWKQIWGCPEHFFGCEWRERRARSAQAKKSRSPKIHNFRSSLRPLLQIDKRMKDEGVVAKPAGASSSEMLILCYGDLHIYIIGRQQLSQLLLYKMIQPQSTELSDWKRIFRVWLEITPAAHTLIVITGRQMCGKFRPLISKDNQGHKHHVFVLRPWLEVLA